MLKYIPIQLIQYSITENKTKELRLFLFLKNKSSTGVVKISIDDRVSFSQELGISTKTFKRHINNLKDMKWINTSRNQILFLRSWERLQMILNLRFTSRVEFHTNYITKTKYKGYFAGAIMSYQCKLKDHILWMERKNRRSLPVHKIMHPLSISYLSNLLRIPETTLRSYKTEAINNKFIFRKRNSTKVSIGHDNINIHTLRKNWDENSFPIKHNRDLLIIESDTYSNLLHFKRYRGQNPLQ